MEPAAATPLAAEVAFLRELLRSNRQQHRASKHFRLSAALVARAGRLAPVSVAIATGEASARAAAAHDAIPLALAAARGVREDLARGFFAALNACWLACLGSFGRVRDPSICHRVVFAQFTRRRPRSARGRAAAPRRGGPPRRRRSCRHTSTRRRR